MSIQPWILAGMVLGGVVRAGEPPPPLPEATRVTLKLNDARPAAAFDELMRQTGYLLVPADEAAWKTWAAGAPAISVSLEEAPFWAALRDVCDKSGAVAYGYAGTQGGRGITLMPRREGTTNPMRSPASLSGAFMITATGVTRMGYADLSRPDAVQRQFGVQMMGFAEPKLRLVRVPHLAEIEAAVDEKGNSLLPDRPAAGHAPAPALSAAPRSSTWAMSAPLQWRRDMGEKIARLKGVARVSIQTGSDLLEVPDVMKPGEIRRKLGEFDVTFKEITKVNERQWQVEIAVLREAGLDRAQLGAFMAGLSARLTDEQEGRDYVFYGPTWTAPGANPAAPPANPHTLKLLFYDAARDRPRGEPTRLVLELTTETREIAVPFEFEGLAIP